MSSNPAIAVSKLGKQYRVRASADTKSVAEVLTNRVKNPFRRARVETFEALRDVSFTVEPGEAVGIIGHNGAGKSTLLKVLTQITKPTSGEVRISGRVGSLLEVGTGFHSELTGRENVFLNGAILGMQQSEIAAAFDEIVDFAGVGAFLDTPVKRYSSGMTVRLAFSVAAHLRCDVLLVDEVLAVGDAQFQERSRSKMTSLTSGGRTVLLVSHSMEYVNALCSRGILLDHGRVAFDGPVREATQQYFEAVRNYASNGQNYRDRNGSGELRIVSFVPTEPAFAVAQPKTFQIDIERFADYPGGCHLVVVVADDSGIEIAHCESSLLGLRVSGLSSTSGTFTLKSPWLKPGRYSIGAFLVQPGHGVVDAGEEICEFYVDPVLPYSFAHDRKAYDRGIVLGDFSFDGLLSPTSTE